MSKKISLVPELRFPGFKNLGDWSYENGNKLFQPISNKNHDSDLPILAITQENGAVPRSDINYNVVVTDKSVESYKVVDIGDFVISLRSFQGGIEYSNYKGICSPAYIILRKKHRDDVDAFYKQYFKSLQFIQDLNRNLEGIRDGKMVSYAQFSEILSPKPESNEQQKIADCLSSLDDCITAQSQKLDFLKAHKKGLMQDLFPAEGESKPRLRFRDFEEDGKWEHRYLKSVFSIFQGFAFSSSDSVDHGMRWLKIADVGIQQMNHDTLSFLPIHFKEEYKRFLVAKDDLVIALTRPILGDELKLSRVDEVLHNSLLNQRVGKLESDENLDFIYYLLQTYRLISLIKKNIAGNEPPNLSSQHINDISVYLPSKAEQQKIADCLSSLDEQIQAQTQRIEALKLHKKGLMQQLFPTTNELP